MTDIIANIRELTGSVPAGVTLVAVSKTKPVEDIMEAYSAGQRVFGENRAQEMASKHDALPGDMKWHMIGHLQTNKVKYIAPFVEMIHSVDSLKLLSVINREAEKKDRIIKCLLQFHIALEETKFGFSPDEINSITGSGELEDMNNISVCGVMGMGTFTNNMDIVRKEFKYLKRVFDDLKDGYFSDDKAFKEISMGMSGDWQVAVEEGSTMVRIGSTIFGERYK